MDSFEMSYVSKIETYFQTWHILLQILGPNLTNTSYEFHNQNQMGSTIGSVLQVSSFLLLSLMC